MFYRGEVLVAIVNNKLVPITSSFADRRSHRRSHTDASQLGITQAGLQVFGLDSRMRGNDGLRRTFQTALRKG